MITTGVIRRALFGVMLLTAFCAAGCYPARALSRQGLRGRVLDDETGQPVSGADMVFRTDLAIGEPEWEVCRTVTGADGRFRVKPDHDFYITWPLSGPVLVAPYPTSVTIAPPEQPSVTFGVVTPWTAPHRIGPGAITASSTEPDYLDFGDIRLGRPQPP